MEWMGSVCGALWAGQKERKRVGSTEEGNELRRQRV